MAIREETDNKTQFSKASSMSAGAPLATVDSSKGKSVSDNTRANLPAGRDNIPARRSGIWTGLIGSALGLLWLGGSVAYLAGFVINDFASLPLAQILGLALFVAAPAAIFVMAGLLAREVIRASNRAERLEASLERLSMPADAASDDVRVLADAISGQINRVNVAMESALARLAAMEEVITHHADSLEDSTGDARVRTEALVRDLKQERDKLSNVSDGLDDKAAMIASAIQDQSKMVAAAAELAESKAADGERLLRGGADRLTAAGAKAEEAGERVALALDARSGELRDFVDTLKDRTDGLETAYLKHRDRLTDASEILRKEQEKIAAALDFHKAELENMSTTAREGADTLKDSATHSGEVFLKAVNEALGKARDLSRQLSDDSEAAADTSEEAVARLKDAAKAAREAAEEAASRFDAQAEAAHASLKRVNEAGFEASRTSEDAFQERLKEAEALTEKATSAAATAAEKVREQLKSTVDAASEESQRIEKLLSDMRDHMKDAPTSARQVVEDMERTLSEGLEKLNATASEASENAREVDQIFQARVRQNYELLSDFMLRMGSVAGGRKPIDLNQDEVPDPLTSRNKPDHIEADDFLPLRSKSSSKDQPQIDKPKDGPTIKAERVKLSALSMKPDQRRSEEKTNTSGSNANSDQSDSTQKPADQTKRDDDQSGSSEKDAGWRWKDILATMDPEGDPNKRRN